MGETTSAGFVVPFNEHARVRFEEASAGACVARIPDAYELTNHIGTVHGGALFTVAEAASGRAFMHSAAEYAIEQGWDLTQLRAVVRGAQIRYLKPARGEISARARVLTTTNEWSDLLCDQGKAKVSVAVDVSDAAGTLVAHMQVEWHLSRKPSAPEQSPA
jgi:uncharacterized protein (TIGR00369 family)